MSKTLAERRKELIGLQVFIINNGVKVAGIIRNVRLSPWNTYQEQVWIETNDIYRDRWMDTSIVYTQSEGTETLVNLFQSG